MEEQQGGWGYNVSGGNQGAEINQGLGVEHTKMIKKVRRRLLEHVLRKHNHQIKEELEEMGMGDIDIDIFTAMVMKEASEGDGCDYVVVTQQDCQPISLVYLVSSIVNGNKEEIQSTMEALGVKID